jgi:hypothetical protein
MKKISRKTPFHHGFEYQLANLVDIILDVEDYLKSISIMSRKKMIDVKSTEIIETKLAKKVIGNDIVDLALARKETIGNDRYIWIKYLLKRAATDCNC